MGAEVSPCLFPQPRFVPARFASLITGSVAGIGKLRPEFEAEAYCDGELGIDAPDCLASGGSRSSVCGNAAYECVIGGRRAKGADL